MSSSQNNRNNSFLHKCRKSLSELGLFLILLVLPALTIWISLYHVQNELLKDAREEALADMAEMTSHMLRLAEPETYYQESLRNLAESFKWVDDIEEISRISNKEILELALFDENGVRLKWPVGENLTKIKTSQSYLAAIKRFAENPGTKPTDSEKTAAIGYSGNESTLAILSASPNTLINFQGIGLRKMGGWFKVQFKSNELANIKRTGDLFAWLNLEKLDKYALADKTINTMQKLTNSEFTFSYIDLKNLSTNRCSRGRKFKYAIADILSANSLKSSFIYNDELFSINDTKEGIRLICSRPSPKPLPLLKNYNNLLFILVPVILLLFIWKKVFNVKIRLSLATESVFIFGFASIIGFTAILIGSVAYRYEKNLTITQKYKNDAVEILEKVDQQYSDSFDDLLRDYRFYLSEISSRVANEKANASYTPQMLDEALCNIPKEVLKPLVKAYKEDVIAYAVYIDYCGRVLFQVPSSIRGTGKSGTIADRYSRVVNRIAIQSLKSFNSSKGNLIPEIEPDSIKIFTTTAVEGLLAGRSKFIETKFDSEDTLAFMDFSIDKDIFANGCLLVIHEPRKLEMNYLKETGLNISKARNFELVAVPKTVTNQKSYYPRYSYIFEEPIWKLNDTVNQTQLPCFKKGRLSDKEVIVAAISANTMKNYNLFLAIPVSILSDNGFSLSKVLLVGTGFSLVFIIILSLFLSSSIVAPINILKKNVLSINKKNKSDEKSFVNFSESSELESISTGLTNLVIKTKEFNENNKICSSLMPFIPYSENNYEVDAFSCNSDTNVFSYMSVLENDILFMVMIRPEAKNGLEVTLPLSMAGTAMKIFVEQQEIRSPLLCVMNLEEYFRLNFKSNMKYSILAMFLDLKTNVITYSGYGKISLLKFNHSTLNGEVISIPNTEYITNEVKSLGNITCDLPVNCSFTAISELINSEELNSLQQEFFSRNISNSSFKDEFRKTIFELAKRNKNINNIDNVLLAYHKEESKSVQFNKKLAENNPIALIRSQKNRRQTDA